MESLEIWFALCMVLVVGVWLYSRRLHREIKEMEKDIRMVMDKIMFMRIEKHDNKVFAYNAMSEEFICQGTDMDDLNANFGKRYPGRRGVIVEPKEETPNVL